MNTLRSDLRKIQSGVEKYLVCVVALDLEEDVEGEEGADEEANDVEGDDILDCANES